MAMKIGELAKRTGVSVRALHYYEEIRLLPQAERTRAGHRLYPAAAIARLQQVRSLQDIGLSLSAIRDCLNRPDSSPIQIVEQHLAEVGRQIAALTQLRGRLARIEEELLVAGSASVETLLAALETMSMIEKYFTPEQQQELRERLGEERMREGHADFKTILEQIQAAMVSGVDPHDSAVQELAGRLGRLHTEFSGGLPGLDLSVDQMLQQETNIHGMDAASIRQIRDYLGRARSSR